MAKLLILDLSNITHRSIHGYPEQADDRGRPIHGAFGMAVTTLRMARVHEPTHIVAACDTSRSQLMRTEWAGDYKQNRSSSDDTVAYQLHCAKQVVRLLGVPCVHADRWEADDVCASYAAQFAGEVVVATGDKDMLSLIDDRVRVHLLGRDIVAGPAECVDVMGVTPGRVCDFKALVGDPSDGYAGVPGIGKKGAIDLLAAHADLDGVLAAAAAGKITGRYRKSLGPDGVAAARHSLRMATLKADLPVHAMRPWVFERAMAEAGLAELGLGGVIQRIPPQFNAPTAPR